MVVSICTFHCVHKRLENDSLISSIIATCIEERVIVTSVRKGWYFSELYLPVCPLGMLFRMVFAIRYYPLLPTVEYLQTWYALILHLLLIYQYWKIIWNIIFGNITESVRELKATMEKLMGQSSSRKQGVLQHNTFCCVSVAVMLQCNMFYCIYCSSDVTM